ncbi:MAG: hypothetical protein J2P27_13890 [Actinobacteria bacterium]|nr:hypothetical protein [Actinomycetota bacterium]
MSDLDVVVTGIVGALGIAGTLLGTWLTLRSQNERTRRADMRALYTAYLTTANAMATALKRYPEDGDTETKRAYEETELRHALQMLYDSHNQALLMAPDAVKELIDETTAAYEEEYSKKTGDSLRRRRVKTHAGKMLDDTFERMRADLKAPAMRRRIEE